MNDAGHATGPDDVRTPAPDTPSGVQPGDRLSITVDGWGHGGEAVGRLPDGRACFVARAIPGETVDVVVRELHKRHASADLVGVVQASPHRVTPPCPVYEGCGGCQLQHVDPSHQLALKRRVVVEQLERIAKISDPPVDDVAVPEGAWPAGYRSWARMAVAPTGELGFRRARSHDVQPVPVCLLLDDHTQALRDIAGDDWVGASEVTVMAGDGGALVDVTTLDPPGELAGGPLEAAGEVGIVVDGRVQREPATIVVTIDDVALRTSAGSFFQAGTAGAAALVDAVMQAVDLRATDVVADLYAGSGLLTVFLARTAAHVIAVEANHQAAADARGNLAGAAATTDVHATKVESWLRDNDQAVDIVVLDPPRRGARAEVVAGIVALAPRQVVYVACDPAALARDTRRLVDSGYALRSVKPLDLFGHTAHVEAVATFTPAD